jgi:hypothetical protein
VNHEEIVMQGYWLYADKIRCEVRIVRQSVRYGTGDYEDPPDIRDDRDAECFAVRYQTSTGSGFGGGGQFDTLEEAIKNVEQLIPSIEWSEASKHANAPETEEMEN